MNDNEVLAEERTIEEAPAVEEPNVFDDVIENPENPENPENGEAVMTANDEENPLDIDALIAEAEQRGYLRGLNERAEKQLQRPSVGSAPEQERREYTAENNEVMILNNIRKSVWDI